MRLTFRHTRVLLYEILIDKLFAAKSQEEGSDESIYHDIHDYIVPSLSREI